jgi:hypothetical protein
MAMIKEIKRKYKIEIDGDDVTDNVESFSVVMENNTHCKFILDVNTTLHMCNGNVIDSSDGNIKITHYTGV